MLDNGDRTLHGLLALLALCATLPAQGTLRASVSSAGTQGSDLSLWPSVSADGRFVAFTSAAGDLVGGDTNASWDVFVRDRATGVTEIASVDPNGVPGNGYSEEIVISPDGRWAAFVSYASNLVPADTNGAADVFVRDRQNGTTQRVSLDAQGHEGNGDCHHPVISPDGRFVAFMSLASNLVPGDTNARYDIFVRDLQIGTTQRVSVDSAGLESDGDSQNPSISADGRFVAFESFGTNLVPGDTNASWDIFVRDLQSGTIERVSVDSTGAESNGNSLNAATTADGRIVAFESRATNLVPNDTNNHFDVFVHDRQSGTTVRVSVDPNGVQENKNSFGASISPDGRFVGFSSDATIFAPPDTNYATDVFLSDLQAGTIERVSVDSYGGQANSTSGNAAVTPDGRFVAFVSHATNLVPGDTNGFNDIFLRDRAPSCVSFCFGDGSGTACPCGNAGTSGNGCANSLYFVGAHLIGIGTTSIVGDTLRLVASGMPETSTLFYQGTRRANGGAGTVFGDGLFCLSGAILRLATKTNYMGSSQYPGAGDATVSVRGGDSAGDVRTYQVWYRNPDPTFCTTATFNLTNGIELTWTP